MTHWKHIFFFFIFFISVVSTASPDPCFPPPQRRKLFQQRVDRFWEYEEGSKTWVQLKLPYDLFSCTSNHNNSNNCTKVGVIFDRTTTTTTTTGGKKKKKAGGGDTDQVVVSVEREIRKRKRISMVRMSETSVWVTGESGSIYERFWNGVRWVIAPHHHHLPLSPAYYAVSVFTLNHTILSLSQPGLLYQMQFTENSDPVWVEFSSDLNKGTSKETEQNLDIKSGVTSQDKERLYFCTKNGLLLELNGIEPPSWVNHGRPPGADVAAIVDAASIRRDVVFTVSSSGDLYEYDRSSKPSWKKHIWREGSEEDTSLAPSMGCALQGLAGPHSISLFLLTKGGNLVERRLHRRKWKWIVHGSPKDHHLTSMTLVDSGDDLIAKTSSLFLTTATGFVFEYRVPQHTGNGINNEIRESWVNHKHPENAKTARSIAGLQLQIGRILFPLDDGRLAELHLPGIGGQTSGPTQQISIRRKAPAKYVWTILDAPETEGWNAEYCTEERGPLNCVTGIRDGLENSLSSPRRRKSNDPQPHYLSPSVFASKGNDKSSEQYTIPEDWTYTNFRLRVMHGGTSLFFITDGGLIFEYVHIENMWLWLKHEHSTAMKGVLANYNGSLFLVDKDGDLLIRERSDNELSWLNCTAMKKGRRVLGGPPWDGMLGKAPKAALEDSIFFVGKNGKLLQFIVAMRKFKWKDCQSPPTTKIASIVDQELFRENVVFVVGKNGRLYQYNKVTELWHEHYQSQHLVLSRMPGTAMRPSPQSLTGSLFMLSEDGGLVEYHWDSMDGWNWVEHGTPSKAVTFVGSTGPCYGGNQLFLIGSDGEVYLRYMNEEVWRWKNFGFPYMIDMAVDNERPIGRETENEDICADEDFAAGFEKIRDKCINNNCDAKVKSTRPIRFADDSVIFELRDGRLAEMREMEESEWEWMRIIGTPTTICLPNYWTTALAS